MLFAVGLETIEMVTLLFVFHDNITSNASINMNRLYYSMNENIFTEQYLHIQFLPGGQLSFAEIEVIPGAKAIPSIFPKHAVHKQECFVQSIVIATVSTVSRFQESDAY